MDPSQQPAKTRLHIRFTKRDDVRWISHRDLARVWERLLRRAGLQLAFSQGFHPKPRISFPSALALGIEALDEVVELEVLGEVDLSSIGDLLRREMPPGMDLLELRALDTALGKAKVLGASYRILHQLLAAANGSPPLQPSTVANDQTTSPCGVDCLEQLQHRMEHVQQQPQVHIEREGKTISCSTSDPYFDLKIEGDYFIFALPNLAHGSIRPSELLAHMGLGRLLEDGLTLQRTAVHLLEVPTTSNTN
jgi:radical SAM-linked protein